MSKKWEILKIKDVVQDLHQGLNTAGYKIKFVKKGYPIIQTRNLENGVIDLDEKIKYMSREDWIVYKDKYKPKIGDVFLTNIGTIGKTAVVTEEQDYLIHWNIFIFKVNDELINSFYLKAYLDTPFCDKYYRSFQKGGTVNFITKKMIENLEIPLPSLSEQKRIVAILDEAFAVIDKAKANAEKNLQNAKELFESYLQNVFANKNEDWEEKRLGEVLQKTEMIDPTKSPNNEFIYIDVSSVNKENLEIENTSLLKGKDAPSRARKLIKTNDVIFATVRPTLKRIAIISPEYNGQVCSTGYFVLRSAEQVYHRLIFYYLQTKGFIEQMEKLQRGASYPAVTDGNVKDQIFHFPKSMQQQKKLADKLSNLSIETKKLEAIYQQKLNVLQELKKSILQKAFNGELTTATKNLVA